MYSRQFTILPLLYCRFSNYRSLRIVLAPRGMLLKGKLQFFKFKKLLFLKLFVGLGFQKALCVQVTSLEEKSAAIELLRIAENQVRIVPNIAAKRLLEDFKIPTKNKGQLKIYFSSRIAHEKNLLFALNIVEQLNIPIEFDIFGVIDHEKYWEKCLQKIQKLPSNISLNYKGEYNPTKIGELFESYHAFFFPTFGENYGHVIIEALSMGKPVVTTPTTPWSDMEVNNAGWVIDLKDEKKYQAIFLELFEMEQREYAQYAKAAYEYATRKINEVDYVQQYQKLFG